MAIDTDDFIVPKGKFVASLFPTVDINELIDGYVQQSAIECASIPINQREKAQRAYVYWRGWEQAVILLNADPAKMTTDGGTESREYTDQQIQRFERYAQEAKADFDALNITVDLTPARPQSQTIKLKGTW